MLSAMVFWNQGRRCRKIAESYQDGGGLDQLALNGQFVDPSERVSCVVDPVQALGIGAHAVRQLEEVSLAKRGITELHPNFLLFQNLQTLDLRYNSLTTLFNLLPPVGLDTSKNLTGPKGCLRLQRIYLSYNSLKDLSLTDIPRLLSLEELYLDHNDITDPEKVVFHLRRLKHLKVLDLRGNPCSAEHQYRSTILRGLRNLQRLDRVLITKEELDDVIQSEEKVATISPTTQRAEGGLNRSGKSWPKSATMEMLESKRNRYIKTVAKEEENMRRAEEMREENLRKEKEAFHSLWTHSGTEEEQTRISSRANQVTPTVDPEQESYLHAALAGRHEIVQERTGALPWSSSLLPASNRLAEIQKGTAAVRQLAEGKEDEELHRKIKEGRSALIPPPWEDGSAKLEVVSAQESELQSLMVRAIEILLLPEEVKSLEATFGAAEILQVLSLRQLNYSQKLAAAANGGAASEPASPKSGSNKRPSSKRSKQNNPLSQQQQQLAFSVEAIMNENNLLKLLREPFMMKPPRVERGATVDSGAASGASAVFPGYVGTYGKTTVDRFLSCLQQKTGAWELPTEHFLKALIAIHKVQNDIQYNNVATSSKKSVASYDSRVDESGETKSTRSNRSVPNKSKRQATENHGVSSSTVTDPPNDNRAYLSVNNLLGALAFYLPFVESRCQFFTEQCTAAVGQGGSEAKEWFSRKQAACQHKENLVNSLGASPKEDTILSCDSVAKRPVATVGSFFGERRKHSM